MQRERVDDIRLDALEVEDHAPADEEEALQVPRGQHVECVRVRRKELTISTTIQCTPFCAAQPVTMRPAGSRIVPGTMDAAES